MYLVYERRRWVRPAAACEEKFKPFHSLDDPMVDFSYVRAFYANFFMIPRFVIGWCLFLAGPVVAVILSWGEGHLDGKLPEWKLKILKTVLYWGLYAAIFLCGTVKVTKVEVDADYKKWLGPDWVKTYKGAGMKVTNHQH